MTTGSPPARRRRAGAARFLADCGAATAVEFALLAPIFFGLVFSLIETGIIYARMSMLESAANQIAKQVYIGSVTSGTLTRADLESQVCSVVSAVVPDCTQNITIELTPVASYVNLPTTSAACRDSDTAIEPMVSFNPGGGGNIVFMRICLTLPVLTPGLGVGLSLPKTGTGKFELVSASAFMNEP